ncbi:hypothetical protein A9Q99_06915 [Gammaproteobacteria bacterium 45_16_T64]|nr:hypothetical protein A9Q99_06915 [Gammaproteobacteria bacterium 45_16_T64]
MNKKIRFIFTVLLLIGAPSVFAMSDAEIEKKFDAYEAKIKALEKKVNASPASVNKKMVKNVKKNKKRISKLKKLMDSEKERFQMNGFMTVAASKADAELGSAYHFNDRVNFRGDSKVGMQFDYKLSEDMDATIQLVARSRDEDVWTADAEWAYVGKRFTDWMKVRVGRLRIPFYLYSESLDVGYSYPWVRPPIDLYTTLVTSFDGMDVAFKFPTGPVNHRVQVWVAGWTNTDADALDDIDVYDTRGVNITSSWRAFTLRLATTSIALEGTQTTEFYSDINDAGLAGYAFATGGTATCLEPSPVLTVIAGESICSRWDLIIDIDDTITYNSLAFQYDNGTFFTIYEAALLDLKEESIFGNGRADVVTFGYRFQSWTPYIAGGVTESDPANLIPGSTETSRRSWLLGLQHILNDSTSIKFEWNHLYDFEGTDGFDEGALEPGETDLDDANIYTIAIDAVF